MLAATVLVALLAGLGFATRSSETRARRMLTDRFAARTSLTTSFASNYLGDVAGRERAQAERLLASPSVDEATFDEVIQAFGFDAAVLLDGSGHLLQLWPHKPELRGRDMTIDYAHLRAAVHGHVAVSQVVPSAANGTPITAVAVPFDSSAGRRVLSGAFAPAASPLGAYFATVVPVAGGNAFLLDGAGRVITAGRPDAATATQLKSLNNGVHSLRVGHEKVTASVRPVQDTAWRVVLTVPSEQLFSPASAGRWVAWLLLVAIAAIGTIAIVLLLRLRASRAVAIHTAGTDLLTGLANRRATQETLTRVTAEARRHHTPLVALLIDLDRFKDINDRHGHQAGDVVLRDAAHAIVDSIRVEDVGGRWGGEEFTVVLPRTDLPVAVAVAERVREAIASCSTSSIAVSASVGVGLFDGTNDEQLLRAADAALYEAKRTGRNRVCVDSSTSGGYPHPSVELAG
ncbi:MAG: GGDEF domain-containing protein [Actinobacteria bacterium]|nr:GGDEF domain-containing protein [Actinomycetota bacterium]